MSVSTGPTKSSTPEQLRSFPASEGLSLAGDVWGDPEHPPVLLLHGGGQTRHAWGGTADALSRVGFHAVTLDQRGHGDSDWHPEGVYTVGAYAEDLCAVVAGMEKPPVLVGASLGGLASILAVGESEQDIASAIVLVDVTPRLEREGVEKILNFMRACPEGFGSLDDAAEAVARYLPHRPRPRDTTGLAKNLRLGPDGRYRWHWDPRFLEGRGPGSAREGFLERLFEASRNIRVPVLLVRGRMSEIVTEENAREFLELVPHAEYVDVSDAAHMVAGDRNDAFSEAVVEFLGRVVAHA